MKKKIIYAVVGVVLVIAAGMWFYNHYLFMPWEYHKGDALYYDWYDYSGEIEMYLCSDNYDDGEPGRYCAHVTDRDEIKWVLTEFMEVDNVTHSRKEWQEYDVPEDWGEQYIIEISQVYSRGEDGHRDDGRNVFVTYVYENTSLVDSYKGSYYFYHATDDLLDYIYNYKDENIN